MSKWIVIVMMLIVFAMFWKGVEVLGPSNTNRDIIYTCLLYTSDAADES